MSQLLRSSGEAYISRGVQGNGSRGNNWGGALVWNGMDGWEGLNLTVSQLSLADIRSGVRVLRWGYRVCARCSLVWGTSRLWRENIDVRGSLILMEMGIYGSRVIYSCQDAASWRMGPRLPSSHSSLSCLEAYVTFLSLKVDSVPPASKREMSFLGCGCIFVREFGACERSESRSRLSVLRVRKTFKIAGVQFPNTIHAIMTGISLRVVFLSSC